MIMIDVHYNYNPTTHAELQDNASLESPIQELRFDAVNFSAALFQFFGITRFEPKS